MSVENIFILLRYYYKLILFISIASVGVVAGIVLSMPKLYTATVDLVIDVKGIQPISDSEMNAQLLPGYIATQIEIVSSPRVVSKTIDRLKNQEYSLFREKLLNEANAKSMSSNDLVTFIKSHMSVKTGHESSILTISYSAHDSKLAAAIANVLADSYLETNQEIATDTAKRTSAWLDDQVRVIRDKLEQAQQRLTQYQQKNGIVATDKTIDVESNRLAELSSQVAIAQRESYEISSKQKKVPGSDTANIYRTRPEVVNNPLIQRLKEEIAQQQSKFNELSVRFGKNHHEYKAAAKDLLNLRKELDKEIETIANGIQSSEGEAKQKVEAIEKALQAQKQRVLELNRKQDEITLLQGDVANFRNTYEFTMKRANQSHLESAVGPANVSLLNRATPPSIPSSPKVALDLALAFFVGLLLGVAFIFLMEMSYRRIRCELDISKQLNTNLIGIFPASRNKFVGWHLGQSNLNPPEFVGSAPMLFSDSRMHAATAEGRHSKWVSLMKNLFSASQKQNAIPTIVGYSRHTSELCRKFRYPILTMGENDISEELSMAYKPFGEQAEHLRMIRGNLIFGGFSIDRKILPVISPGRLDGRSLIAANLAIGFAQLGKNTLLIDANMRTPRQHELFGVAREPGLSDFLASPLDKNIVIRTVPGIPCLAILSSGTFAPNPVELLNSQQFSDLLLDKAPEFDLIILDTPAANLYVDALTIVFQVGVSLVVARRDYTPMNEIQALYHHLEQVGGKVIGTVLNS